MTKKKPIRVYICSSLKPHNVKYVDKMLVCFKAENPHITFFRPYGTDPDTMLETVKEDIKEIRRCDELWICGKYGRDSSFEIGFAMALGKKVKVYKDHTNAKRLDQDEMYKSGLASGDVQVVNL